MRRLLAAALLLSTPYALDAQAPLESAWIGTMSVEELGVFDFSTQTGSPNYRFVVFRQPQGWAVSSMAYPGDIQFFDAELAPRGSFGRTGEGPGEVMGMPSGGLVANGWLIADPGQARVTLFDSGLGYVEAGPIPGTVFSTQVDGDALLLGGQFSVGGQTTAVLRIDSGALDRFEAGPTVERFEPRIDMAIIAPAIGGEIWSFNHTGGRINILDRETLTLVDSAMIPLEGYSKTFFRMNPGQEEPPPQVLGAAGNASILFVFAGVGDSEWEPDLRDPTDIYDTEVLAIEARTREVVARHRFDDFCQPVEGSTVACLDSDSGNVRLLRLSIAR